MEEESKERYFICPECGELKIWSEMLKDASSGGNGLCSCRFADYFWNEKEKKVDVWYPRVYVEYMEISNKLYTFFKGIPNNIIRVKILKAIPKECVMDDKEQILM